MIEKIGQGYIYTGAAKGKKLSTIPAGQDRTPSDGVEVSGFGQILAMAMSESKKIGDVDQNKVDAVKRQIDSGNYNPNMGLLASKLLAAGLLND